MLFNDAFDPVLAVSQPAHAWISGQLMRAWKEALGAPVLLAAEQHDIGWLDWETTPSFDPETGRPHLFRHVAAADHAPMWARGVERALGAWGPHVALLVSRHGSLIYTRFTNRSRLGEADAAAVTGYLETQAALQAGWAAAVGLGAEALAYETAIVAFSDGLSLALCGELRTPVTLEAPVRGAAATGVEVRAGTEAGEFTLSPWPFRGEGLTVEVEARPLPAGGRFEDAAAMRAWHAGPARAVMRVRVSAGTGTLGTAPVRGVPPT